MHRKNCISGLFFALFFLFFFYLDLQMGEDASYWPGIICKIGFVLSIASAVISGMKWKASEGEVLFPFHSMQLKRLGIASLILIFWCFGMQIVGFLTCSAVCMALIGVLFEPVREKACILRDVVVAIVFAVGMYALFTALGIQFPKGFLI